MYPHQLIGKTVIRTAPTTHIGDRSFSTNPIVILSVTESHIVYKYARELEELFGSDKSLLNSDFIDNKWIELKEEEK